MIPFVAHLAGGSIPDGRTGRYPVGHDRAKPATTECGEQGCGRDASHRGYCPKHYQQRKTRGEWS